MNNIIIKLLGFIIGFFIALTFFSYYKNIKIEKFHNIYDSNIPNIDSLSVTKLPNDITVLPYNSEKFLLLSTYKKNYISNNDQKWYNNDININKSIILENNSSSYFTYNNILSFIPNNINTNGANSVNIKKTILKGPLVYNFANKSNFNNYELTSFSLFFTLKINNLINDTENILFEMIGNTNYNNYNYEPSVININIIPNKSTNDYNIQITIGNMIYDKGLKNISSSILLNNDPNFIGLIYNKSNIYFILNNNTYTFKNNYTETIILGTRNFIINKDGNIDANIYSVIYYKKDLNLSDIALIKAYNNYYISGLDYLDNINKNQNRLLQNYNNDDLSNKLNKCLLDINKNDNNKIVPINLNNDLNIEKIKPININHYNDNDKSFIDNLINMFNNIYKDIFT